MPRIPFPNVPKLPGVPQVLRSPNFPASLPPIVGATLSVARLVLAFVSGSGWGIYKINPPTKRNAEGIEETTTTGTRVPVIVPDSFMRFEQAQEWSISSAPTEEGGFTSFNKVDSPFETRLRLVKGGSQRARTEFLNSIKEVAGSLQLFDIVTPEQTYQNVNITRFQVVRDGPRDAYFLQQVDLYFEEIRLVTPEYSVTTANTSNARTPDAQPVSNRGLVQGADASGVSP